MLTVPSTQRTERPLRAALARGSKQPTGNPSHSLSFLLWPQAPACAGRYGTLAWFVLLPTSASAQDTPDISQLAQFVRWGGVFLSLFVVGGSLVLLRVVSQLAAGFSRRFSNHRMLIQKLESVVHFTIYLLSLVIVVSLSIRLDSTALTVIGGALAFAVGFAMRDLVAAFIAGITIIFDKPFQVGDRVQYAGEYGDIVRIGLRSVRMNTLDHNLVTIPNNKILTDVTSSANYGALEMQVGIDFYIGVDQDLQRARALIQEACLTSRYCYMEEPVPISARQVIIDSYIAYHIKARPYVLDVKYEKAFETDVHIRVQTAFERHGIAPPAVLRREVASKPPAPAGEGLPGSSSTGTPEA